MTLSKMGESQYFEWEAFRAVYLEDSFVLEITNQNGCVSFVIDAVLTEEHPEYTIPKANEMYCYKRAKIEFSTPCQVNWIVNHIKPFVDANQEIDYGNIDAFYKIGDNYFLSGDWGEVIVKSDEAILSFYD